MFQGRVEAGTTTRLSSAPIVSCLGLFEAIRAEPRDTLADATTELGQDYTSTRFPGSAACSIVAQAAWRVMHQNGALRLAGTNLNGFLWTERRYNHALKRVG